MPKNNLTKKENLPLSLPAALPGTLLRWYDGSKRPLPWRRDQDPYHVWVSEIMLQQTGVLVVTRYYERFLATLPTIKALAEAEEATLLKLWEGLGYYSRVRNMQKAAQQLMGTYGGRFPETHDALLKLPGIGAYTAGAIASICFQLPTPAVDGNVARVVARLCGLRQEITEPVKKSIESALRAIYPTERPGDFTQSLMELGATICLPNGEPRCSLCPVAAHCTALQDNTVTSIPVKKTKAVKRIEEHTVLRLTCGDRIAIRRRDGGGLLGGLWELPHLPGFLSEQDAVLSAEKWGTRPTALLSALRRHHIFTHIRWELLTYTITCREMVPEFTWVTETDLENDYSLPTAFKKLL